MSLGTLDPIAACIDPSRLRRTSPAVPSRPMLTWSAIALLMGLLSPPALATPRFASHFRSFDVGASPTAVGVGDVDGDGRPDLVVGSEGSHTLSFLRGNGDGTFADRMEFGTVSGPA